MIFKSFKNNSLCVYCNHCQKDMLNDFKSCPVCGNPPYGSPQTPQPPPPPPPQYNVQAPNPPNYQNTPPHQGLYKNEGTAILLAAILGFFGLSGIGHLYIGKIGRGIGFLIVLWILYGIGIATAMLLIGIPFLILGLVIYIWHIFNVRNLCREYNDYLSRNGRPPW